MAECSLALVARVVSAAGFLLRAGNPSASGKKFTRRRRTLEAFKCAEFGVYFAKSRGPLQLHRLRGTPHAWVWRDHFEKPVELLCVTTPRQLPSQRDPNPLVRTCAHIGQLE
jgi:hypothetical protein